MTCDLLKTVQTDSAGVDLFLIPFQTDSAGVDLFLINVKTDSLVDLGWTLLKIFDMLFIKACSD